VTGVYLLGIGHVRVDQHRVVNGRVKTITVKREACRWYVVLALQGAEAAREAAPFRQRKSHDS
jgi:putative transposase